MTTKVHGFAIALTAIALGATCPAWGQFMSNYPVIIVPPPAQNYATPKPTPKRAAPDKPKPPPDSAQDPPVRPHYQGRTLVY
jgi:hypothetical protein